MAIGDELATLDFQSMIGAPLISVIKAQAQSAQTSVDFIKSVGFDHDANGNTTTPTMVTFNYQKNVETQNPDGTVTSNPQTFTLTVPILTMLPVPFIRVQETTVDFNAKITSVQESTTSSSHDLNASLAAKGGWGPVSVELKVNYAYRKSTTEGSKVERTYTMAVNVKAVQDELPAGTERLMSILENTIQEKKAA